MKRLHIVGALLLTLLVLDETLGAYHKSSKESKKKNKKTEDEVHVAKKKYSEAAAKQHYRKVREVPVEVEEVEEIEDTTTEESLQSNKVSKKQYKEAVKQKKDKKRQAEEELYVKERRKIKENEGKAYKKLEGKKQRRELKEDNIDVETLDASEPLQNDSKENLCSQCQAEDSQLDVVTVKSKSPRLHRYIVEEEILDDEDVGSLEDEELNEIENVPAQKCYYK